MEEYNDFSAYETCRGLQRKIQYLEEKVEALEERVKAIELNRKEPTYTKGEEE